MVRQLFLHVGDCKTGSTILQTMLAQGDCTPQRTRLFYPGQGAHGQLARSLGDRRKDLYPARWNGIARRLGGTDWDVAVLSSELFEFISPDRVAEAVRVHLPEHADSLRVIAYVRPHASRFVSQFAENLKLGHSTGNLEEFHDRFVPAGRLDYATRLGKWRDRFGDRLIVRPFLRARLRDGDVRRDFLSLILGGEEYTLRDSGQDDNAALPVADLALMRMLQRRFHDLTEVDVEARVAFGKHFGRLLRDLPSTLPAEKLRLSHSIYARLLETCRSDAEQVDSEWFDTPCFLPELEKAAADVAETAQSLEPADYHGPETLRLMQAWAELILRQMTDDPKTLWQRFKPRTGPA